MVASSEYVVKTQKQDAGISHESHTQTDVAQVICPCVKEQYATVVTDPCEVATSDFYAVATYQCALAANAVDDLQLDGVQVKQDVDEEEVN